VQTTTHKSYDNDSTHRLAIDNYTILRYPDPNASPLH
jgi:hypothetical protein